MSFQRDIKKTDTEIIRVEITEFKGEKYVNIRVWYLDKDNEWKPTKKGVAVKTSQFGELKQFLLEAEAELKNT